MLSIHPQQSTTTVPLGLENIPNAKIREPNLSYGWQQQYGGHIIWELHCNTVGRAVDNFHTAHPSSAWHFIYNIFKIRGGAASPILLGPIVFWPPVESRSVFPQPAAVMQKRVTNWIKWANCAPTSCVITAGLPLITFCVWQRGSNICSKGCISLCSQESVDQGDWRFER